MSLSLGFGVSAFAGENWIGTWKLDPAKSKLGTNVVRVETLKFEVTPSGIKLTSEGIDPDGRAVKGGYARSSTARTCPGPATRWPTRPAPKKVDDNTYENIWKHGRQGHRHRDGRRLDGRQDPDGHPERHGPEGAAVSSVAVYDKQ